ncbi:Ig-like domain-containing protein [Curtobacterium sp. MCPF17_002]|uniref:Ig-like domain-containing protein n=1 Tax=Curtobacterium sp. MCPF17_002 TaxID=2175645 RepID=UPI000DA920D5|nr:Ig-like domain-containing protein [Curtobacterium sp. MCPF17_002]WIB78048.1 Ig-like domain-containing protein [Curtobacterium sp. MCPF17_002]
MRKLCTAALTTGLATATIVSGLALGPAAATALPTEAPATPTATSSTAPAAAFTARVGATDIVDRSAVLHGTGTPSATIRVGDRVAGTVGTDGTWKVTVDSLRLGINTLTVQQVVGGTVVDTATVTVTLTRAATTGSVRFAGFVTERATMSGTATGGATVIARDAAGTRIGSGIADGVGGAYSFPITAPNKAGATTITVWQSAAEESFGHIDVTANYGSGVDIVTPAAGSEHEPGRLVVVGHGEANSLLEARLAGSPTVIGTGEVNGFGDYTLRTSDLAPGRHTIEVTQKSRGANTTTASVAVVVKAPAVSPLIVTSPTAGSTVTTPRATFAGRGHDGAKITVRGTSRTVCETTVVNGRWSCTADFDLSNTSYALFVDQTVTGSGKTTATIAFQVAAQPTKPLAVTSPGANAVVTTAKPTFTGTGAAGATITVRGTTRTICETTVRADGTWSCVSGISLGNSTYNVYVDQKAPGGATSTIEAAFSIRLA